MRMVIRSIPVLALALGLSVTQAAAQQQPGNGDFQWYIGPQAGVMLFKTPTQGSTAIPAFGGQTLIVARRTGLLISVEEGVGSDETSAYSDLAGTQTVTFNDIRKYSAMLMAFPIKSAAQPYLGVGWGIIHVVNPQTSSGFHDDAVDLGSSGFGSFIGGLQFQVGRFMAYGQYQITTGAANDTVEDATGAPVAFGRLLEGPTHTFSGGLRFGLGSSREKPQTGGY